MTTAANDKIAQSGDHELYRAMILKHARSPQNFGPLPGATHRAEGINPLCGDKLELSLEIARSGQITGASFEGTGCAISLASASILTESVQGLSVTEAIDLFDNFCGMLDTGAGNQTGQQLPEALYALAAVRQYPSRVKCATLAWHALASATGNRNVDTPVTTE